MARDTNNKRQNERLARLAKLREQADDEALKLMLSSEDGRRVLSRVARDLGWMGDGWDPNSARLTDFNAGRRSGAADLMKWAERVAPEHFLAAIGEATRRDKDMADQASAATQENSEDDDG